MMTSTTTPYSMSWSNQEDSAYHEEPHYTNTTNATAHKSLGPASYESSPESSYLSPDYDDIEVEMIAAQTKGLVYNLATEGIFRFSKTEGTIIDNNHPDSTTKSKIMNSNVFCIHKKEGCKWQGPLNKLKGHLNACQKDAVACLNQCGAKIARQMMEDHMLYTCHKRLVPCLFCNHDFTGSVIEDHQNVCGFEPVYCENKCGQKIQRNRLKSHQVNTCSKRLVDCNYCSRGFTADTIQIHHRNCNLFPVPCPNRCNTNNISREDIEKHLSSECPKSIKKIVEKCCYLDAGCQFQTSSKKDMESHVRENVKLHLDLMCGLARRQQAHIAKLTGQLERANTSFNGILMWRIKDFSAKMKEAKETEGLELLSAPFYTSQSGYKLQASLFLNGNGAGEGGHISTYIKILPGEYDGILRWPFQHTVSFSLLDQNEFREKACNVIESFIPDSNWLNFQRPSRTPDQLGFGFPRFITHEIIYKRQYIKDDCILIKIRVDPCRNVAV